MVQRRSLSHRLSRRAALSAIGGLCLGATLAPAAAALARDPAPTRQRDDRPISSRVLLFSKTVEYHHDSIPEAIAALTARGPEHSFRVESTEDASVFADATLAGYLAVVFLMTTGDVLDDDQQAAFERYIQAGGGYVGIHSASDTEYNWPWYGGLVGAYFKHHPDIQNAVIQFEDQSHPAMVGVPDRWSRTDEWYDFQTNPREQVNVLARLDESTYSGGEMGDDHPIAWYHAFDGGRAFYTAGGHTSASYREPVFLQHLLGGISYAAGLAPAAILPLDGAAAQA
jgi:type 1 glutamine amidotransferase